MWTCSACTYRNLSKTSSKCHVCQNAREDSSSISSSNAVIDLTEASPKRNGGSMESWRRRKRRTATQVDAGESAVEDSFVGVDAEKGSDFETGSSQSEQAASGSSDKSNIDAAKQKSALATSQKVFEILSSDDEVDDMESRASAALKAKSRYVVTRCNSKNAESVTSKRQYNKLSKSSNSRQLNHDGRSDSSKWHTDRRYKSDIVHNKKYCKSGEESRANSLTASVVGHNKRFASQKNVEVGSQTKKTATTITTSSNPTTKKSITDYYNNKQPTASSLPIQTLMQQAQSILQQKFNHSTLRPLQQTAIRRALQRTNQIIVMATGGGKSLCYQLPALVGFGTTRQQTGIQSNSNKYYCHHDYCMTTIVVCPLIALMMDQVRNLHKRGIYTAVCLSGSLTGREKAEIYSRLLGGLDGDAKKKKGMKVGKTDDTSCGRNNAEPIQLLYVTPELIKTDKFRGVLSKLYESNRLFQFAIDEAHCVSTWGHDFRTAYKELSWLRESFPDVPVMACTGTATAKVIADIRNILQLDVNNAPCIMGTFNRTNISYEVRFKDSLDTMRPDGALVDVAQVVQKQHEIAQKANEPCSGIIYVHKRDDCAYLAARLSKLTGLVCAPYHAGLKDCDREDAQRKWTDGVIQIAVATIAFGMGIDLPHVRYVIHWTMARSLEGFYQESGRGGRDGKPSISILYYSKNDAEKFAYMAQKNAEARAAKTKGSRGGTRSQTAGHEMIELEGMINYCTQPRCRRKHVLEHFGEDFDAKTQCNKTCDFCINPEKVENDTKAAECMSAVIDSKRAMHRHVSNDDEQTFHHNPLDSDESYNDGYESDGFLGGDDGLMGLTDYGEGHDFESSAPPKTTGFVKASSVLSKYEKMECQQGKKGGFVNFKTITFNEDHEEAPKKQQCVEIPAHLRSNMPDPHAGSYKKTSQEDAPKTQSASDLQAQIDELYKQREKARADALAILASRGGTSTSSSGLSVPSLSFKKRR